MSLGPGSSSGPELPPLSRALGSLDFPLRRSVPGGDDRPFTLVGAGLRGEGGCARGLDRLATVAGDLLMGPMVDGAEPLESLRTPLGLERRLHRGGVELVERIALSLTEPVAFFEWEAASAVTHRLRWSHPAGPAGEPAWQALGRGLVVGDGERRTIVALSEPPADLTVTRGDDGALVVRAEVSAPVVRLAVAYGGADEEPRVLRVMGRPHVVVPAARAAAQRVLDERLGVDAPEPALVETVSWAALRLAWSAAAVRWPEPADPEGSHHAERAVRHALASLATGDAEPARRLVSTPPSGDPRVYLGLLGRYLAWTGDRATIRGVREAVRRRVEALLETDDAAASPPGLAEALEDLGEEALAGRLRERGASPSPGASRAASWRAEPLRLVSDAGAEASEGPRGAAVVEAVVHGLLDAEPDAARGRLVLRPRLPAGWDRFSARNLVVGGSAVGLEYRGEGGVHRFTLGQRRGGAPLQVVFEPELPGMAVAGARVDGAPASLDAAPVAGRLRVPVQLVLDHERVVEVEMRTGDH